MTVLVLWACVKGASCHAPVQREIRVTTDILVIGGGIVGLSAAMQLTERYSDLSVTVIEKEAALASHQTGHNSGVIHAGVYYAPGSLKARFCREGSEATYAFCRNHGLPVEQCGKLIVATNPLEESRLEDLLTRCRSNGLAPQWIDGYELRRMEPHIVGRSAILVSTSGIADYPAIARKMAAIVEQRGGKVLLESPVIALRESRDEVIADTPRLTLRARFAIVCAGLMADRMAGMCGIPLDFKIVPFRGEYFRLPEAMNGIVSRLIYPVPNPELPFLGVHLTRMIGGYVTVGPNAVLALAREGYRWRDLNPRDLLEMAMFPGLHKMLRQHGRSAVREFVNSVFKRGYLAECTKYCPELTLEHLEPHPAGVRAQAVQADGTMIHDFLIKRSRRSLHVCNAPSPAATAALPIGRYLVDRFSEEFSHECRLVPPAAGLDAREAASPARPLG
jgi:L-2-hydroxyglutarate oxidase